MKIKNNLRKKIAMILSVAMLVAFVCAFMLINGFNNAIGNKNVYAAETSATEESTGAVFKVDNKASVRLDSDVHGIKFYATMSHEYYEWLKSTYPDSAYTLTAKINRYENPVESDVRSQTYALGDSDFIDLDGNVKDFTYAYTLKYDSLTSDLQNAYALVLKAEADVTVSKDGADDVVLTADGCSVRSMSGIAKYIVDNNLYNSDTDKTVLEGYYGAGEATAITASASIDFLHKATKENNEEVDVLTFDSALSGDYKLYINAVPLTKVTDTQYEISDELKAQLKYDTDYTVYAFDADNKTTSFNVHTYAGVIKTAEDFKSVFELSEANVKKYAKTVTSDNVYKDFERDFTGNYVLENDITVDINHTGMALNYKTGGTIHNANKGEIDANNASLIDMFFAGTLDGQGHKISVTMNMAYSNNGLFGKLRSGAVIKNLFIDATGTSANNYLICKDVLGSEYPVFDNCYLTLKETSQRSGANHRISDVNVTFKNSVIDYSGLSYVESSYGVLLSLAADKASYQNTVLIGEKRVVAQKGNAAYYASNDNETNSIAGIYRFNDYGEIAAYAGTDLKFDGFDSEYWEKDLIGVPVFKSLSGNTENPLKNYMDNDDAVLQIEVGKSFDAKITLLNVTLASLNITSAENYVEISDYMITGKSIGEGKLTVSYTVNGVQENHTVKYEVVGEIVEVNTEAYYSAADKKIYGLTVGENETIVSVKQNGADAGTLTAIENENGGYTLGNGLTVADTTVKGKTEVLVSTSGKSYKFTNVVTVAKAIASVDDWTYINISSSDTETKNGYVLVIKDLDTTSMINLHTMTGKASPIRMSAAKSSALGLRGTFDGNGHTIKVKSAKSGVFGAINGLTIKDVCFIVDATANYPAGEDGNNRVNVILATVILNSELNNVVVKLNSVDENIGKHGESDCKTYLTLANCIDADSMVMQNIVIDYGTYQMTDTAKNGGLLSCGYPTYNKSQPKNVYIVHNGSYRLGCYSDPFGNCEQNAIVESWVKYASNETDSSIASNNKISGIYRYDSVSALESDANYSSNSDMKWSLNDNNEWTFAK